MPSPLKPEEFCAIVPSGTSSLCDRLLKVFLQMPQKLCDFFTWMLNSDGTLSDAFKDDAQIIPTGTVIARLSVVVPTGWLACNGQEVSRETYALLFATIGTTYGTGNGTTTFNVPDIRDRFLYGKGSTSNVGDTGGEAAHTLTVSELPAHDHGLATLGRASASGNTSSVDQGLVGYAVGTAGPISNSTDETGQDVPHPILPPFMRVAFLIKT